MLEELESTALPRSRAGARHLMGEPAVVALANDTRLVAIAAGVLGGSAVPFKATLFDKSAGANWLVPWHQDTALPLRERNADPEWGPWSDKAGILYAHAPAWALRRVAALRVQLDGGSADNGPLRVVPNSHDHGVLEDGEVAELVQKNGFEACVVPRGGVLMMRPLTIHSSTKMTKVLPRRVLHIEYADSLELGAGVRLALA